MQEVVDYWDRRPCNVKHGTAPIGTEEWSQQVTGRKYFVEPHIPGFADFSKYVGKDVLEMGCGIGTDTLSFLQAGARVDALDISEESLSLAVRRCLKYVGHKAGERPTARFFAANIEDWYPGRRYDLVYSFGVLHHTLRPERALYHAYQALKPGGELKIMLYSRYSWKNLFTLQQPEAQGGCPLAKTYSVHDAREMVWRAGFRAVLVKKAHIFPYRIKEYVKHEYKLAFPWNFIDPKKVEKYLGWHLLIHASRPIEWRF
jgi:SAM-dependent methyltransferase